MPPDISLTPPKKVVDKSKQWIYNHFIEQMFVREEVIIHA